MAKRIALGLLVLAAITGVLGAQNAPAAKAAVSLDLFPLFKGIIWSDSDADNSLFALAPSFEYLIHPHFTLGAAVDLYFGEAVKIDIFYFGLAAHGRWYPLSSGLDKLFIDTGLGFNVFSLDGETDSKKGGFAGITMSLKAGYKLMFNSRFFLEPSMAFVYAKTPSSASVPTPLGWQPGLSIGGAF
ncbi:MAG: autotransporter outer membrane beta-barrel domain-containing protein [Treponema sp.]|nr:autotransporter outer membrane beta-barrel domain-containing protein [Treponema sp.]